MWVCNDCDYKIADEFPSDEVVKKMSSNDIRYVGLLNKYCPNKIENDESHKLIQLVIT